MKEINFLLCINVNKEIWLYLINLEKIKGMMNKCKVKRSIKVVWCFSLKKVIILSIFCCWILIVYIQVL
jgi:hypothetical protein